MFFLRDFFRKKESPFANSAETPETKIQPILKYLDDISEDKLNTSLDFPDIENPELREKLKSVSAQLALRKEATRQEIKRSQHERDRQTMLLKFILDNIPFPVFVKDEFSRYILVNRAEARLFNLKEKDLLGKDDSHFVTNPDELKVIRDSDARALLSDSAVQLPLQHFTATVGHSYVFRTTKIPFVNPITGGKNILGVSIDLTENYALGKRLQMEKRAGTHSVLINITARQSMLSQQIAFYAGAIHRGKNRFCEPMKNAIVLFDHSFNVLNAGGIPMGIYCEDPLPPPVGRVAIMLADIGQLWSLYKKAAEHILENAVASENGTAAQVIANLETIENQAENLLRMNEELMNLYVELTAEKKVIL